MSQPLLPPPSNNPYGPPNPYGYQTPPPASKGSGKVIAIIVSIIALVVLAFCGGLIAFVWWIADSVEDGLDDWDPDRAGGRSNPIAVEVGEEFEIDGIEYDEGWQVVEGATDTDADTITELRGTNDREDERAEYVRLTFTFIDDERTEVGEITCSSSGSISHGNAEKLDCLGLDQITEPYTRVEVHAN